MRTYEMKIFGMANSLYKEEVTFTHLYIAPHPQKEISLEHMTLGSIDQTTAKCAGADQRCPGGLPPPPFLRRFLLLF